jgi:putative redox protein
MPDQIAVQLHQVSDSTSEAQFRSHKVFIDRPLSKGGTDLGPMGGELFLASIGGCFMSNLLAAIKARAAGVTNVRTEVIGILASAPARFSAIELHVQADSPSLELMEWLVQVADRGCIMMNTLRGTLDFQILIISGTVSNAVGSH